MIEAAFGDDMFRTIDFPPKSAYIKDTITIKKERSEWTIMEGLNEPFTAYERKT